MWDSSSNSSWVLRAMRRPKLAEVPGKPSGMATSNGCTGANGAADAGGERGQRGAQHVHPRIALGHHRQ